MLSRCATQTAACWLMVAQASFAPPAEFDEARGNPIDASSGEGLSTLLSARILVFFFLSSITSDRSGGIYIRFTFFRVQ